MNAITPINEARLMTLAPSIFAAEAHHSRSERYGYVNSIELIRALVERGFEVTDARQSKARSDDKKDHTKHIVRLRHSESHQRVQRAIIEGKQLFGDTHTIEARTAARSHLNTFAEVVFTNSHDGTSAVILHAGLLRLDCFNGLILADSSIASIHVTHSKRLIAGVIDGAFAITEQLPKALQVAGEWRGLKLSRDERLAYAEAAHQVRFADAEGKINTAVEPAQLLNQRRDADVSDDLWTTFNVVQENAMRGGLRDVRPGHREADTGKWKPTRRLKTRPVNGIDGDVRLNKSLWMLAEKMAELKGAKAA